MDMKEIAAYWDKSVKLYGKPLDTPPDSYVSFDLETTGYSRGYDSIIEIGAIKVIDGKEVDTFSTLIKPKKGIPADVTELTGITKEMVKNAPTSEMVMKPFVDFVGDLPYLGHNIEDFDLKFVIRDYHRAYKAYLNPIYFDVLNFVRKNKDSLNIETENNKLVTLADYYGIDKGSSHRALDDARTTYKVYERLKEDLFNILDKQTKQISMLDYSPNFLNNKENKVYSQITHKDALADYSYSMRNSDIYWVRCMEYYRKIHINDRTIRQYIYAYENIFRGHYIKMEKRMGAPAFIDDIGASWILVFNQLDKIATAMVYPLKEAPPIYRTNMHSIDEKWELKKIASSPKYYCGHIYKKKYHLYADDIAFETLSKPQPDIYDIDCEWDYDEYCEDIEQQSNENICGKDNDSTKYTKRKDGRLCTTVTQKGVKAYVYGKDEAELIRNKQEKINEIKKGISGLKNIKWRDDVGAYEVRIRRKGHNISKLFNNLDQAVAYRDKTLDYIENGSSEVEQLKNELLIAQNEIIRLQQENAGYETLKAEYEANNIEIADVKKKYSELNAENDELKDVYKELRADYEALEEAYAELEYKCDELEILYKTEKAKSWWNKLRNK